MRTVMALQLLCSYYLTVHRAHSKNSNTYFAVVSMAYYNNNYFIRVGLIEGGVRMQTFGAMIIKLQMSVTVINYFHYLF